MSAGGEGGETVFVAVCSCGKAAVLRVGAGGQWRCDDPSWRYHADPDDGADRDGSRLWHCGAAGHYQAGLRGLRT